MNQLNQLFSETGLSPRLLPAAASAPLEYHLCKFRLPIEHVSFQITKTIVVRSFDADDSGVVRKRRPRLSAVPQFASQKTFTKRKKPIRHRIGHFILLQIFGGSIRTRKVRQQPRHSRTVQTRNTGLDLGSRLVREHSADACGMKTFVSAIHTLAGRRVLDNILAQEAGSKPEPVQDSRRERARSKPVRSRRVHILVYRSQTGRLQHFPEHSKQRRSQPRAEQTDATSFISPKRNFSVTFPAEPCLHELVVESIPAGNP